MTWIVLDEKLDPQLGELEPVEDLVVRLAVDAAALAAGKAWPPADDEVSVGISA